MRPKANRNLGLSSITSFAPPSITTSEFRWIPHRDWSIEQSVYFDELSSVDSWSQEVGSLWIMSYSDSCAPCLAANAWCHDGGFRTLYLTFHGLGRQHSDAPSQGNVDLFRDTTIHAMGLLLSASLLLFEADRLILRSIPPRLAELLAAKALLPMTEVLVPNPDCDLGHEWMVPRPSKFFRTDAPTWWASPAAEGHRQVLAYLSKRLDRDPHHGRGSESTELRQRSSPRSILGLFLGPWRR